jgi:DnaA N-terminal domain
MINTTKIPKDSTNCSNSAIDLSALVPELSTKSQLNKIIVNTNGKPDHLAINLYWDTFRSWYNPNKIYTKDGNVLSIKKLKTKGIYTNYQKLSELHGVSKDTIRKKIIKLERLGLTNRSFQHKETVTTKSYNQLIIYVWKDTPYFFNTLGVDKEKVVSLNPQTNYKYIEEKHNIVFTSQALQNDANQVKGGIRLQSGTKELNKLFSKEKDRSMKSNFLENSFEEEKILKTPTESICNSRVVTAYQIKNTFALGKELKDFYPLTKDDCQKLQSSSKRKFSLNAMNEILLDMSKRLTNRLFNSKKGFLSYMSKVFSYELRDAVKINNESFKIKDNQSKDEQDASQQEEYLTKIEYSLEVSPEWHFKKRLASVLPRNKAYNLLKSFNNLEIERGGICRIILNQSVELTNHDKQIILTQVKATHNGVGGNISIERIEFDTLKKTKSYTLSTSTTLHEEAGIWGRVRQSLISIYGEATDRNWFSKLEAVENVEKNELKLKAPTSFVKDWIESNYFDLIEKVTNSERYKVEFC